MKQSLGIAFPTISRSPAIFTDAAKHKMYLQTRCQRLKATVQQCAIKTCALYQTSSWTCWKTVHFYDL